jgi:hypothetical protein
VYSSPLEGYENMRDENEGVVGGGNVNTIDEEEEKDGFAELITERQRSRLVGFLFCIRRLFVVDLWLNEIVCGV